MIDRQKAHELLEQWQPFVNTDETVDRLEQAISIDLNDPATENLVADAIVRLAPEGAYVPLSTRYPWRFGPFADVTAPETTLLDVLVEALRCSAAVHEAERIPHLVAPLLALAEALEHGALVLGPPPGRCGALSPVTMLERTVRRSCELLATHAGMHEVTVYDGPPDTITPGTRMHWADEEGIS